MAKKKKKHNFEFSKIILAFVILSYFRGLEFGIESIRKLFSVEAGVAYIATSLCGLFSYIGAPVAIAIAFYSNKAKAENIEKIRSNSTSDYQND